MPNYKEQVTCNSILHATTNRVDGTSMPWNHLCTKPIGHLGRHECWSSLCPDVTWTNAESTGIAPFQKRKFTDKERAAISKAKSDAWNRKVSEERKAARAADPRR